MRTFLLALVLMACGGETTDSRFSTPEHTVRTLLSAYGLEDATQEQIRETLASQGRFEIRSRSTFAECFEDFDEGVLSEGLGGYVFGALAVARDDLQIELVGDTATVSPREGVNIIMHRDAQGRYLISLHDSVPAEVRERMIQITEHAETRAQRGTPE